MRDLVWCGDRVVGAAGSSADGDWVVRARCVIGADGRNSTVARRVDAPLQAYERAHRGFYYRYFYDMPGPRDGAEFHEGDDERAYVFPSDNGVTCVAVSLPLVLFNWVRSTPELGFAAALRGYPGLRERVFDATEFGPLLGCGPTPNYIRWPFGASWALVGDASIHQDPWSGVGMDQASVYATFLADAVDRWLSRLLSESDAMAEYACRRDADALARYERTVLLSRDLRQQLPVGVPSGTL